VGAPHLPCLSSDRDPLTPMKILLQISTDVGSSHGSFLHGHNRSLKTLWTGSTWSADPPHTFVALSVRKVGLLGEWAVTIAIGCHTLLTYSLFSVCPWFSTSEVIKGHSTNGRSIACLTGFSACVSEEAEKRRNLPALYFQCWLFWFFFWSIFEDILDT
jgi:hypothetical protein